MSAPSATLSRLLDGAIGHYRPESTSTDWGETLLVLGILRATQATGSTDGKAWLKRWIDYHTAAGLNLSYFVGSWGIGLFLPELIAMFPQHRVTLEERAVHLERLIRRQALRNGEGLLLHNVDLPHIYIDTIFYSAPVLGHLARITGSSDWGGEALGQLEAHLTVLRDTDSKFFVHCEQNLSGLRSAGPWARGNGWVSLCCSELLDLVEIGNEEAAGFDAEGRNRVASILLSLSRHLLPLQGPNGLWTTLLDEPDSYAESSATAMFLVGLRALQRHEISDSGEFDEAIARATDGLSSCIDDAGRLQKSSGGTWPGDRDYYRTVETGEFPWGTGATLLAQTSHPEL